LIIFLALFIAALFTGALLTYPFYLAADLLGDPELPGAAITATQVCGLAFSLLYLKYCDALTFRTLGLKADGKLFRHLAYSVLAGLLIFAVLAAALMLLGIYGWHGSREITPGTIIVLLLGALLTGLAVGLFEETVFRGALQGGLAKRARPLTALVTISMIYAAVHFIDYREPVAGTSIGWLTAAEQFPAAYNQLVTPATMDAFLALFVLGMLLGLVRIRTGNIIQCIGLHAGLVAGVKLFRFFTEYRPGGSLDYLVSSHDHRLGYLALIWLVLIAAIYFYYPVTSPAHFKSTSDD
jgi:membrane protease YdiL (CAAX protease family)